MDPLAITSGALGIAHGAFLAAKSISDIVSSIKDGPRGVASLSHEVAQLQDVLERLAQSPSQTMDTADKEALEKAATNCRDDLEVFSTKLAQQTLDGADSRKGRVWRRLKGVFDERGLARMRDVVHDHFLGLTVVLGQLQLKQASLSTAQGSEILSLLQKLQETVKSPKRFEEHQNSNHPIRNNGGIGETQDTTEEPPADIAHDDRAPAPRIVSTPELSDSISRLMKLVQASVCTMDSDSEEAEARINDLETVVSHVQEVEKSSEREKEAECPYDFMGNSKQEDKVGKELQLVKNLLLSSPALTINGPGTVPVSLYLRSHPKPTSN
jgi:hypothetical protein